MSNRPEQDVVGQRIKAFEVRGHELDVQNKWVGADVVVDIPPVGRFLLNIVTKEHYLSESLEDVLETVDNPDVLLAEGSTGDSKPPYVLNDSVITDEILERKFANRLVEEDLASSLWYEGSAED